MSFVSQLRVATARDHDGVDARFGAVSLDDPAGYRRVLRAHARALPAVETVLAASDADLPTWRPRTAALAADLAALDLAMPEPLPFAPTGEAAHWGALYVLEGSRLGGQLLARSVGRDLPAAYLSARHQPGEWRALLAALDARAAAIGEAGGEAWGEAAIAGARATFGLYAQAAAIELDPGG